MAALPVIGGGRGRNPESPLLCIFIPRAPNVDRLVKGARAHLSRPLSGTTVRADPNAIDEATRRPYAKFMRRPAASAVVVQARFATFNTQDAADQQGISRQGQASRFRSRARAGEHRSGRSMRLSFTRSFQRRGGTSSPIRPLDHGRVTGSDREPRCERFLTRSRAQGAGILPFSRRDKTARAPLLHPAG